MSEFPIHPVPAKWKENAWINKDRYQVMYRQSIEDPDAFWAAQAEALSELGIAMANRL